MGGPAQPRRVADPNAPPQQGMIYPGRVSNVMDFGCFVQLEGCKGRAEGLVHISLISQGQLRTPHDAVKRGQPCFVKVLSCTGSKMSPLYLPYISPISPLYLPGALVHGLQDVPLDARRRPDQRRRPQPFDAAAGPGDQPAAAALQPDARRGRGREAQARDIGEI